MSRRRIRNVIDSSSDDDDENTQTSSQTSSTPQSQRRITSTPSQTQRTQFPGPSGTSRGRDVELNFDDDDYKKAVGEIVFYLIVQERKRLPLKRSDAFKACDLGSLRRDAQDAIWNQAADRLRDIFGFELIECDEKKGFFFLINKITESTTEQHINWSDKESARTALLFMTLSSIWMSNGVLNSEELFEFYRKLGIYEKDSEYNMTRFGSTQSGTDELFPNPKDLVFKIWQRQLYLDIKKIDTGDTENQKFEIRWGPRANVEVKKSSLLQFVSVIYGKSPMSFQKEFKEIERLEGQEVANSISNS